MVICAVVRVVVIVRIHVESSRHPKVRSRDNAFSENCEV